MQTACGFCKKVSDRAGPARDEAVTLQPTLFLVCLLPLQQQPPDGIRLTHSSLSCRISQMHQSVPHAGEPWKAGHLLQKLISAFLLLCKPREVELTPQEECNNTGPSDCSLATSS